MMRWPEQVKNFPGEWDDDKLLSIFGSRAARSAGGCSSGISEP